MEITDRVALQKARLSRAYLDQAKSFGIEQDLEFCPCLDPATINSYNQSLASNYNTPMMSNVSMRPNQSNQQQQSIDSESIFKILAAAAANINTAKNVGNINSTTGYESISRPASAAKISNMNILKNTLMRNQNNTNTNTNIKTRYFS